MLVIRIVLFIGVLTAVAWRGRSSAATAFAAAGALLDSALATPPSHPLALALRETAPLTLFLTATFWLAGLAEQAGVSDRLAGALERAGGGSKPRLYALVCALCAALTATVSLDGAVILMVPLLLALTQRAPELRRPLLLGTVAVANAFSLAVPQGNPANVVVMERLGLSPGAFVAHLFAPALVATVTCAAMVAFAERARLRGRYARDRTTPQRPASSDEKLAAATLAAAAVAGAVGSWFGLAPWWSLSGIAAAVFAAAHLRRRPVPRLPVPVRLGIQIAALAVVFAALAGPLHPAVITAPSLAALVALSLAAGATASIANNLPASVVLTGIVGSRGLSPYAALAGLSAGALATPHGSVATLVALDGAARRGAGKLTTSSYVKVCLPAAAIATAAATALLWLLA